MRNKKILLLISALTAGCFLFLSGCGVDLTNIAVEETTLSAEMEGEDLTEGTCQVHGIFYNTDNSPLAGASVRVLEDGNEVFSGTTDESGALEGFNVSANTPFDIIVSDASGSELAKKTIVYKLSASYEDITIYPVHTEEDKELVLEVPLQKTNMRTAFFLTDNNGLTIASASPYITNQAAADAAAAGDAAAPADAAAAPADAAAAPADTSAAPADAAAAPADAAAAPADAAAAPADTSAAPADTQAAQ